MVRESKRTLEDDRMRSPGTRDLRPKADILTILRRAGVPEETIEALDDVLDDPVDLDRDGNVFLRHGITVDTLIDRMGGSP
jgi:hypothetical protein